MKIEESPFAVVEARGTKRPNVAADDHAASTEARPSSGPPRDANDATESSGHAVARPRDRMDVSDKVAMFSTALRVARQEPAIRSKLVREMRDMMATGRVAPDVERLATKLIDSVEELSADQLRSTKIHRRYFVIRS